MLTVIIDKNYLPNITYPSIDFAERTIYIQKGKRKQLIQEDGSNANTLRTHLVKIKIYSKRKCIKAKLKTI